MDAEPNEGAAMDKDEATIKDKLNRDPTITTPTPRIKTSPTLQQSNSARKINQSSKGLK